MEITIYAIRQSISTTLLQVPMYKIVQDRFADPPVTKVKNERLVIHQRVDPTLATHLAIFVHGLGGLRYGKGATWGEFPQFIFEDFPAVDIGLYSYVTLLGRLRFWRSIPLEDEAATFADLLKRLEQYQGFVLIGHSMGGILCKGAVTSLVTTPDNDEVIQKIDGLFLMATPQLGSTRVPAVLSLGAKDARVLKSHNRYVTEIETVFRDRIHCELLYPLDDRHHIPCWALRGSDDFWVDKLSAGIGLKSSQILTVGGTHTSIVKPASKDDEGFGFVKSCLQRAILNSSRPIRKHISRPARYDELRLVNELAVRLFGEHVSNLDLMREWFYVNHDVFWVLVRVTTARAFRNEQIVGYFCVIPVTQKVRNELRAETLTGATLPAAGILPSDQRPETIYVGAIAGTDIRSKASICLSLTQYLETMARFGSLEVLTRPVTEDGLRVVEGYEMEPVTQPGLDHIYETRLGIRSLEVNHARPG